MSEANELRRKIRRELESVLRDVEQPKYRGLVRNRQALQWIALLLKQLQRAEESE